MPRTVEASDGSSADGCPSTEGVNVSRRRLFAGLALGTFMAALDQTVVATALPRVTAELGGLTSYTWLAIAYLLTATAFTPLYGRLSDHFGRRVPYLSALAIFVIGSAAATGARTMGQLIGARGCQGLGAAGLLTLAVAVIGDELSPRDRARYQGLFGGIFALASLLGPPVGGLLTDAAGWRWVFAINVPLGVLTGVVVWRALPDVRAVSARVDYWGALLLIGGVSCVLLGVVWGGVEQPWGSPTILLLLGGGSALLVIFIVYELRVAAPVLPVRLFKDRTFAVSCAAGFCVGACMFVAIYFVPLFRQVAQHAGAAQAGRSLLSLTVGLVVGAALSGRIISRTGRLRPFPVAGTALMTAGFVMLHGVTAATSAGVLAVELGVLGLGIGLVMQVLVLAVQNSVPRETLGAATSAAGFFRSMGGTLGTSALGALLINRLLAQVPAASSLTLRPGPGATATLPEAAIVPFVAAMRDVFLAGAMLAGFAFVLTLALPAHRLADPEEMASSAHQAPGPKARH